MAPAVMGYVTGSGATSRAAALRLSVAFVARIVVVDVLLGAAFGLGGTAVIGFISSRLVVFYFVAAVLLLAIAALNFRWWQPRLPSFTPRLRASRTPGGAFFVGVPFCADGVSGLHSAALACSAWRGDLRQRLLRRGAHGRLRARSRHPASGARTFTAAFERALGATRLVREMEVVVGALGATRLVREMQVVVGALLLVGAAWFSTKFFQAGGPAAMLGL